jgi:hypothetical protein
MCSTIIQQASGQGGEAVRFTSHRPIALNPTILLKLPYANLGEGMLYKQRAFGRAIVGAKAIELNQRLHRFGWGASSSKVV